MAHLCTSAAMTVPAALLLAAGVALAQASEIKLAPGSDLQGAIDRAADGATIVLETGDHRGPIRLARRITVRGDPGATITGDGQGSVVTISAEGAAVRDLTIAGSGKNLQSMDSGVFIEKTAKGAVVSGNRVVGNLFGVYVHGAERALVADNTIIGIRGGRTSEAGNGVSVWNAPGAEIRGNDVSFGRDGIFVITSRMNVLAGNRFRNLRFAVHYMYGNDGRIIDNVSAGDHVGFAIMFSNRLVVSGNRSEKDRDHGLLFNYANGARIERNVVEGGVVSGADDGEGYDAEHAALRDASRELTEGPRLGPEKCVFIYNANNNKFTANRFSGCQIGVHFTAGSERNEISGNAFIGNRHQVKYVGTRHLDWSVGGRGNYWSDNPAFDLDGDGIADTAYRPNDIVDKVLWTAPAAKILVNSPAVQILRWAQAQFPALYPGGVVDSRPLMAPPRIAP
jgi:nitrous oxidase accessory protein